MSTLALYFLGSPQIEIDNVPINIRYSKTLAMLIYLATSGEPQRRDTLATLLWPDSPQTTARSSLRRELSQLKKALRNDFLFVEGETIALYSDVWLDVAQFRQVLAEAQQHEHVSIADLAAVIELYRDDFIKGFTLPGCPEFDDWQLFQTENLRQQFSNVLEQIITALNDHQNYEQAIPYARRWIALDPLHENAHQVLMRFYAYTGRHAAALHQFNICQRVLQDELGIEPDETTQTLAQAIQARELTPSRDEISPIIQIEFDNRSQEYTYIAGSRSLFVGRESQLHNLKQAFESASNERGQVRFIVGEAGAGKSALVSEFIQRTIITKSDLLITYGYCDAQTGSIDPYLPFRDALKTLAMGTSNTRLNDQYFPVLNPHSSQRIREVTCRALLEHGAQLMLVFFQQADIQTIVALARQSGWNGEEPRADLLKFEQSLIFEQLITVMQIIAGEYPVLLILEDLHWADSGSIGILYRLATQLIGHSIFVIGTYRPEAIIADADKPHPLQAMLPELQRKLSDIHIDLDAIRTQEGQLLVDGILDAEANRLDDSFRQALYRQTGGHPLFVVELVQDLKQNGGLIQDNDHCWMVGNRLDWLSLPTRVEGAIAGRMAHLSATQHWWLTVASVMGEYFLAEVVAHVAGEDARTVSQVLSRSLQFDYGLVEAQGVERLGNQRLTKYRFHHNLMQVYLYERLDEVERVYLHEDIARILEILYDEHVEHISLILAHHYQQAGMLKQAIEYLIKAVDESVRVAAYEEAYQHLARALKLLDTLPEEESRDRQELNIQMRLGQYWSASKGYGVAEVKTSYTRALDLSRQLKSNQQTLDLLLALSSYARMHNDISSLRKYGEESLLLTTNKDPERAMQVDRIWHFIAYSEGRFFDAVTYAEAIIAFYREHRPTLSREEAIDLSTILTRRGLCLVPYGYADRAISSVMEGANLAKQYGTPLTIGINMSYTTKVYFERRDWQAAIELSEQVLEIAHQYGFTQMRTFTEMNRGISLAMQHNFVEGKALVLKALAERRLTSPYGELATLNLLAEACGKHGKVEAGLTIINEVLSRLEKSDDRVNEPEFYHVKGYLLLQQNQEGDQLKQTQAEAEHYFRQSINVSRERQAKLWELRALASLCQLLHNQGRDDACYQQLADLYEWFTEGFETEDLQRAQAILQTFA